MNRIMDRYLVNKKTGCWEWSLYIASSGYGKITVNGKVMYAHRYAYQAYYKKNITGLVVRHKCDNPCCVNPEHLVSGTQKENVFDMSLRGRRNDKFGESNHKSKFSDFSVEAMRIFYEFYKIPQHQLSVIFGMSKPNVNAIVSYKKRLSCSLLLAEKNNLITSLKQKKQ